MSLIMDLPAQPSSQVYNPGARDTQPRHFVPKKPECGFHPISVAYQNTTIRISRYRQHQRRKGFGLCLSSTPIQRRLTKTK
jgi:hypothetical protein